MHEIRRYSPNTPIILVGETLFTFATAFLCSFHSNYDYLFILATKSDLRMSNISKSKLITHEEGQKMCKDIEAIAYIECSAFDSTNANEIIEKAVRTTTNRNSSHKSCSIM